MLVLDVVTGNPFYKIPNGTAFVDLLIGVLTQLNIAMLVDTLVAVTTANPV